MRKSLLLLMLCSAMITTAQDIKFDIEKTGMFKDRLEFSDIVDVNSDGKNGIIMARSYDAHLGGEQGYFFEHYSDKMIKLKSYDYPNEDRKYHRVGVVIEQNIINVVEFTYDKKQKAYICYANSSDVKDFKFVRKELFRLNINKARPRLNGTGPHTYNFIDLIFNRDKTAFAISVNIDTGFGKEKNEVHEVYVFNRKMDLLMKNSLDKDFKKDAYVIKDVVVGDDGNAVYVLGKIIDKKKKKETGPDYHYDVNKITNNDIKTEVFNTGQYDADDMHLVVKKEGLACLGFYSGLKEWKVEGIVYFDFDSNSFQQKENKYLPFPEEVYSYYGEKADKELQRYDESYPSLAENGEIFLNAEKLDSRTFTHMTEYQYKDILTAKITEKGDIAWVKIIDKFQFTQGAFRYYISYKTVTMRNDIYYFVNGNIKKGENGKDLIDCPHVYGADLNIVKIDTDGNISMVKALDRSQIKAPFKVIYGVGMPNSSCIFFLGKELKNKQLIKVTL